MVKESALYKDASSPIEERVEDLLLRMTLEEKVAQLTSQWAFFVLGDNGLNIEKMNELFKDGIGQLSRLAGMLDLEPEATASIANEIQRYFVENTRLGIPVIIHEECLCGYQAKKATVFPQIIGVAATWDPENVEEMGKIIKNQMRSSGAHLGLSPVLDVARDPRWGRMEETFGEDPYIVSIMGTAYVKGIQGSDLKDGVMATAKHFLGYSATEGGMNWAPSHIPQRELLEIYAKSFEAVIKEADLACVMNSYSEIDGVPCAVSKEILTKLLRDKLGFNGMVVSDYSAIPTACTYHNVAPDNTEAAIQTLEAGLDVELPLKVAYNKDLIEAVKEGKLSEKVIDLSVRRVLKKKFQLGLFENPFVDIEKVSQYYNSQEYRDTAKDIALKSITLLKNEDNILPLKKDLKSIAVIGPNADSCRNLFGDYTYVGQIEDAIANIANDGFISGISSIDSAEKRKMVELCKNVLDADEDYFSRYAYENIKSVLEAVKDTVSASTEIHYAKGCDINSDNRQDFSKAIEAATKSEVVIMVMGGKSGLMIDATSGESRDRTNLELPGVQLELVKEICALGKPVVLVLINGRPLSITWESENVSAIIEAWVPGEEGSAAVADVLFGEYNPGGRLPVSIPRNVGQIPVFYYHKPSGGRSHWTGDYVDESTKPLYCFGYGLSYTKFEYSNLRINKDKVDIMGEVKISLDLENIGEMKGDEVVQLYLHDREATITRPVQQLFGFKRLTLESNEKATITFKVPMNILGFVDRNNDFVVEPGNIDVMIGSSSQDIRLKGEFEIVGNKRHIGKDKRFFSKVEVCK